MSKGRRQAIDAVATALKAKAEDPPTDAILCLIEDGLSSLERIANALETLIASKSAAAGKF